MSYPQVDQCQIKTLDSIYMDTFGYITDGAYVEVGAFNGYNWSNTWGLAQSGWRGLLVEPQPDLAEKCRERYEDNPRIAVEQCCVGREKKEVKLYLGGSISTTDPERMALYNELDWSKHVGLNAERYITCPMVTLDELLEKHDWPEGFEVLVIDVEGAEPDVLAGFDLDRWQPKLVIVELNELYPDERLNANAVPVGELFAEHGYEKVHADTINTIFRRI